MGVIKGCCGAIVVAIIASLLGIYFGTSFFHGPPCALPQDIQTDYVKKFFNISKFEGVWYEQAFHDWTQPIGWCECMRSVKHYRAETNHIFDNFTLFCYGDHYYANLTYNLTGKPPGNGIVHWNMAPIVYLNIPNTVVAVGVEEGRDQYRWVIEYQCIQWGSQVWFAGLNFYHSLRFPADGELDKMIKIAREQGLGYWLDHGLQIHKLDHTGCVYPPVDEHVVKRLNLKKNDL